jgi:hypothetical protein
MGNRRGAYGVVGERSDGKGLFGRPWHRWEDNIKIDFRKPSEGVEWI